ncbi:MAG: hypothetical protein ABN502_00620 [Gammaproteobacteria bacterium]
MGTLSKSTTMFLLPTCKLQVGLTTVVSEALLRFPLLLLASFAVHVTGGTVRFSGRIVDPPCAIGQARDITREIVLDGYLLAAQGARIQVVSFDPATPARLTDLAAGVAPPS